jgi:hypothetical protein
MAFADCLSLTSATFNASLTNFNLAFINCPSYVSRPGSSFQNVSIPLTVGSGTITERGAGGLDDTGAFTLLINSGGSQNTGFYTIPATATSGFVFNYMSTDAGSGANPGITLSTNLAIGFGVGTVATAATATLGRFIFTGIADRFAQAASYKAVTTSGNFKILTVYLYYENGNSSSSTKYTAPGQVQIRFIKNTVTNVQYIEFRHYRHSGITKDGAITTSGTWNLTDGVSYKNTFTIGSAQNVFYPDGDSLVLSSEATGTTWTALANCYVNV